MNKFIKKRATSYTGVSGPAAAEIWVDSTTGDLEWNGDDTVRRAQNTGEGVVVKEVTFTETAGAGVYTGSVAIPAGATLLDVVVNGVALWDNAGAVAMIVGDDTDPNGFFDAVDLKATDLLAGESLSFALAGGQAGAYIANSQVSPRYYAAADNVIGEITSASTGGSAGRTRLTVVYSAPNSTNDVSAATKV